MRVFKILCLILISMSIVNCSEEAEVDIQESAQQVGDVMASVDESGGTSNGTMAFMQGQQKFIAIKEKQQSGSYVNHIFDLLTPVPSAQAVACQDTTFSTCSSSQKVRDLSGCTVGSATFTGNVTLAFSDAACVLDSANDYVNRNPNFTVTGRRSATLTVTKTGTNGQRVTRGSTAGNFTFSNDGIRREFAASGQTLFDYTTQTTTDISVTGTSRTDRVMTGGSLRVTNNLSSVYCDYVPDSVTWTSACNCASSGSWAGTCSDGKSSAINITGCGTATISLGDKSESLTFDRCYSTN